MTKIRQWILMENRLGRMDPEIYPVVVVSLGTAAWGAIILTRKAIYEFPSPNVVKVPKHEFRP